MEEDEEVDSWADYSSQFMFPSEDEECTCEHETFEHDYNSCTVEGCDCKAYWAHT